MQKLKHRARDKFARGCGRAGVSLREGNAHEGEEIETMLRKAWPRLGGLDTAGARKGTEN